MTVGRIKDSKFNDFANKSKLANLSMHRQIFSEMSVKCSVQYFH